MTQNSGKRNTILLIRSSISAIILVFFLHSCQSPSIDDSRVWCQGQADSMWMQLNTVRKKFNYNTSEISARKNEMDSLLRILKFHPNAKISESQVSQVAQYNSIFRVYKGFGARYTEMVLKAEEYFYQLKAIDKRIKAGKYDKKTAEFRKDTESIIKGLGEMTAEVEEVTSRISAVEPAYQRIAPQVEELVSELESGGKKR